MIEFIKFLIAVQLVLSAIAIAPTRAQQDEFDDDRFLDFVDLADDDDAEDSTDDSTTPKMAPPPTSLIIEYNDADYTYNEDSPSLTLSANSSFNDATTSSSVPLFSIDTSISTTNNNSNAQTTQATDSNVSSSSSTGADNTTQAMSDTTLPAWWNSSSTMLIDTNTTTISNQTTNILSNSTSTQVTFMTMTTNSDLTSATSGAASNQTDNAQAFNSTSVEKDATPFNAPKGPGNHGSVVSCSGSPFGLLLLSLITFSFVGRL